MPPLLQSVEYTKRDEQLNINYTKRDEQLYLTVLLQGSITNVA
jgi:hypothetical protein